MSYESAAGAGREMLALPSLEDGEAESLVNSGLEASARVEPPPPTNPPSATGGMSAKWCVALGSSCKKLDKLARSAYGAWRESVFIGFDEKAGRRC